ncbi:unnamed protein product [Cyclocybe aegerita]|uniref:Uncharacterized protein n=1 Tax=Cyclocybe aegerita TaxID=1973307 RepID=A0A8S0W290_CYCAE|nr:unnamed protein product [Cyclocybe aegerita]
MNLNFLWSWLTRTVALFIQTRSRPSPCSFSFSLLDCHRISSMPGNKRKQQGEVYLIFAKKVKKDDTEPATSNEKASTSADAVDNVEVPPLSLKEFAELLDFTVVESEEEIKTRFDRIAKALLHEFRLVVRKPDGTETEFDFLEAEFYLQIEGIHEDPFTHGSEEQKVSGRWYFHRAPRRSEDSHRSLTSTTAYRSGSRKGMDLTLGGQPLHSSLKYFGTEGSTTEAGKDEPPKPTRQLQRGGVLIRSLRRLGAGGKVISGPSLLVDEILSVSGAPSIEDLVENKWERNTSAFLSAEGNPPTCLFLKAMDPTTRKTPPKIYFSPRIGLDLSHPGTTGPSTLPLHPRIRFLTKKYRFFVHPDQLVANGRAQTFLGILESCIEQDSDYDAALKKQSLNGQIVRLSGIKSATAAKYLADYVSGRKAGVKAVEEFIGPKGKGASSSPATYLKMMGALSKLRH